MSRPERPSWAATVTEVADDDGNYRGAVHSHSDGSHVAWRKGPCHGEHPSLDATVVALRDCDRPGPHDWHRTCCTTCVCALCRRSTREDAS